MDVRQGQRDILIIEKAAADKSSRFLCKCLYSVNYLKTTTLYAGRVMVSFFRVTLPPSAERYPAISE